MAKKRSYTGNTDAPASGKRPGTELFQSLLCRRFQASNLGTFAVRDMRGKPGILSVHATGRAGDTLPKAGRTIAATRKNTLQIIAWLEHFAELFEIEEIHDYLHDQDGPGALPAYGRGWRVGRGWKIWTATSNGGPGGAWVHWEISPRMADDPAAVRKAWNEAKRISGS